MERLAVEVVGHFLRLRQQVPLTVEMAETVQMYMALQALAAAAALMGAALLFRLWVATEGMGASMAGALGVHRPIRLARRLQLLADRVRSGCIGAPAERDADAADRRDSLPAPDRVLRASEDVP